MNTRSAKTVERLLVAMEAYRYGITNIFQLVKASDTVRERVLRHLYNARPNSNAWNKAVLDAITALEDIDAELRTKFPREAAAVTCDRCGKPGHTRPACTFDKMKAAR